MLDRADLRILSNLQDNPDLPIAELAQLCGLSHTPCWRRLKKLEEGGYIRGRAVLLDERRLDLSVNVFAEIRLKGHDEPILVAFEDAARDRPEIMECFSMSGDSDYLVRVVVKDVEAYEIFLKKVLLHLPGVASVNSRFALGCIKSTTRLPIAA